MSKGSGDPFAKVMASFNIDVDKWLEENDDTDLGSQRRSHDGSESEYISLDDFALKMQSDKEAPSSSYTRSWDGQDMVYKCSYCSFKINEEYQMLLHCSRLHVEEDFRNTMTNINNATAKWDETIPLGGATEIPIPPTNKNPAVANRTENRMSADSDSEDDSMHIMNSSSDPLPTNTNSQIPVAKGSSIQGADKNSNKKVLETPQPSGTNNGDGGKNAEKRKDSQTSVLNAFKAGGLSVGKDQTSKDEQNPVIMPVQISTDHRQKNLGGLCSSGDKMSNKDKNEQVLDLVVSSAGSEAATKTYPTTTNLDEMPILDLQLPTPPALLPDDSSDSKSCGGGELEAPDSSKSLGSHSRSIGSSDQPQSSNQRGGVPSRISTPDGAGQSTSTSAVLLPTNLSVMSKVTGSDSTRSDKGTSNGRMPMAIALTPSWVSTPPLASDAPPFLSATKTITSTPSLTSRPYITCAPATTIPTPPPLISQAKSGQGFFTNLLSSDISPSPPIVSRVVTPNTSMLQTAVSSGSQLQGWMPICNQTASNISTQMRPVPNTSQVQLQQTKQGQMPFQAPARAQTVHSQFSQLQQTATRYSHSQQQGQQQQPTPLSNVNGQSFQPIQTRQMVQTGTSQDQAAQIARLRQHAQAVRNTGTPPQQVNRVPQQQHPQQAFIPQPRTQTQVPQQTASQHISQAIQQQAQRVSYHFHQNQQQNPNKQPGSSQRPAILRTSRNQNNAQTRAINPQSSALIGQNPQHSPPVAMQSLLNYPISQLGSTPRFTPVATNVSTLGQNVFTRLGVPVQALSVTQSQAFVNFQQALQAASMRSTMSSSNASTTIISGANNFAGGSVVMPNQQTQNNVHRPVHVVRPTTAASGGTSRSATQGTQIRPVAPNQMIASGAATSQTFSNAVRHNTVTTARSSAPSIAINSSSANSAGATLKGQDGQLFMMKQIGEGYVLTPYADNKPATASALPVQPKQIDIHTLPKIKDSVSVNPELLAYLNGREVPSNVKFKCKLCNAKTTSLNMIRWHLYAHHLQSAPRPFKCLKCPYTFFSEKLARDHGKAVHQTLHCHAFNESITPVAQDLSAAMFKIYAEISVDQNQFECQICLALTEDMKMMKNHMETVHNPFQAAAFQCWYCPDFSNDEEEMKQHVKKKHNNQPCQYTRDTPPGKKREKITTRLMEFSKLIVQNTTKTLPPITEPQPQKVEECETLTCTLCSFISVQTVSLENHLRNDHLPFRPYLCHGNDFKAATIKMLKMHLAQAHPEWLQSGSLHKRVSIDGELSACQERETTRLVLKSLEKGLENNYSIESSSEEIIPFDNQCSECKFKASTHKSLEIHIKLRHLLSTPYICRICGVATALKESILKHVETKHPTETEIIFTDESGENCQEEETMKIMIRSICNNSDDQDDEVIDEETGEEAAENQSDNVAESATGQTSGDTSTLVQPTASSSSETVSSAVAISPVIVGQPAIIPVRPITLLSPVMLIPGPPFAVGQAGTPNPILSVSSVQTPVPTFQPILSTVPSQAIPASVMSTASASASHTVSQASLTGQQQQQETSQNSTLGVRIKQEPGIEQETESQETGVVDESESSCAAVRSRISEFLSMRPTMPRTDNPSPVGQSLGAVGALISSVVPGLENLTQTNQSDVRQGEMPIGGTAPVCPRNMDLESRTKQTMLTDAAPQDKAKAPMVPVQAQKQMLTGEGQNNTSRDKQVNPAQDSLCTSSQNEQPISETTQGQVNESHQDDRSKGEQNNSLLSIRTDNDMNAVVISIPDVTVDSETSTRNGMDDSIRPHVTPSPVTGKRGDMSSVTSLFTGEQLQETLGAHQPLTIPPHPSPSTPESPEVEKAFKCHKCEEVFPTIATLRQHCITTHFIDHWPFYCTRCNFRTWNHPLMKDHMKLLHNVSEIVKSDRRRQELLQADLKEMQSMVQYIFVPKALGMSDDSKKTVAPRTLLSSVNTIDIRKKLKFRNQKSKSRDVSSKEMSQGAKSPIVIAAAVRNAPLERLHSIEKGAAEDPDFVGTCFCCQRFTRSSAVEVNIPLVHVTLINNKECVMRCDCDYSSTSIPLFVFHIWSHTGLNLYHCGLCMEDGNEKREMATHCQTKHQHEVNLHQIRLFKSMVKFLERHIGFMTGKLQEHHRKRPVLVAPEDARDTQDVKKIQYRCSYCSFQRLSLLDVVNHVQEGHPVKMVKITMDFRASMDNGITERLLRNNIADVSLVPVLPTVTGGGDCQANPLVEKVDKIVPSAAEGTNVVTSHDMHEAVAGNSEKSGEKGIKLKLNLRQGKRKAVILSDSESSDDSSSADDDVDTTFTKRNDLSLAKEYICHMCDFSSDHTKDLEHHLLKFHTSIRPYKCGKCDKNYLHKNDARNHIHRRHPNSSAKLVISKQMEVIMNEARIGLMKFARQKKSELQKEMRSRGQAYKRIKLSDKRKRTGGGQNLMDPKLKMKAVVVLKDIRRIKKYKRYFKKKHRH